MPVRNLTGARDAFSSGSVENSIIAHQHSTTMEPGHVKMDVNFRAALKGGLAGVICSTMSLCGLRGARVAVGTSAVVCTAVCAASAVTAGSAYFLATEAYVRHCEVERRREMWETENYKEGEKQEMRELYEERGLSPEDARRVVDIISKENDVFVDIMMVEELGLEWPVQSVAPGVNCVQFTAFFGLGALVPVTAFLLQHKLGAAGANVSPVRSLLAASAASTAALYYIGQQADLHARSTWSWVSGVPLALAGLCGSSLSYSFTSLILRQ